jgi:hypothetical protein
VDRPDITSGQPDITSGQTGHHQWTTGHHQWTPDITSAFETDDKQRNIQFLNQFSEL